MKGDFHVRFCGNVGGEIPLRDPMVGNVSASTSL